MSSICMYVPSASGGHARYAKEFMSALATHPRNTFRYELVSSQDLQQQFHSDLYPVHAILPPLRHRSEFGSTAGWAASRMTHYLRRETQFLSWIRTRPDVSAVHFQEWTPWLAPSMVRRIKAMGKRVFVTVHNIVPHKYPRLVPRAVMHRWLRTATNSCDGVFVHTDQLADRLHAFLGEPHPKIDVIPHGVWTVNDLPSDVSLQQRLAMRKLLFFGAIRRNKGLDLLLDAMSELQGFSLTVAGEAIEPDYFREQILPRIERLRAAGVQIDLRQRFTPDEEVGELFQTHSAVVLPYTDGFVAQSGVVFMALAYDLPVIASEVGGLRDIFARHKIGVTFAKPTPALLREAVKRLFSDTDPRALLGEIHAAKRRFSWQDAAGVAIAAYGNAPERSLERSERALETNLAH